MAKYTKRKPRVRRSNLKKTVRGSQRLNRAVNNMKTTKKRRVRRVSRKGRKKSRQSGGKTGTYADAVNLFKKIFPGVYEQLITNRVPNIKVKKGKETVSDKEYILISNTQKHKAVKFRHHFIGVTGCSTLQFKKALKVYIYGSGSVKVPTNFKKTNLIFLEKDPSVRASEIGQLKAESSNIDLRNAILNTLDIEFNKDGNIQPVPPPRNPDPTASRGNPVHVPVYEVPVEVQVTKDNSLYVYSEADACHTNAPEAAAAEAAEAAAAAASAAEESKKAEERQKAKEVVNLALLEVTYADPGNTGQSPPPPPLGDAATYAVPTKAGRREQVIVRTKDGKQFLVDFPGEDGKPKESEFEGGTKISVTLTGTDVYKVISENDDDDSLTVQKDGDVTKYIVSRDTHLVMEGDTFYEVPLAVEL
jgi:hypothetical protein